MTSATLGTLRRLDERIGNGLTSVLVRLGLIEKPESGTVIRFTASFLRLIGWGALFVSIGLGMSIGTSIALHSGPAFFEGRVGNFADATPPHAADVIEDDWFSDTGRSVTRLGTRYHAYSPAADAFSVRVEGYEVRIDQVALICPGPAVVEFAPASNSVAYLRQPPWPCQTLVVALSRTDADESKVVMISLDGSPIPGETTSDALA